VQERICSSFPEVTSAAVNVQNYPDSCWSYFVSPDGRDSNSGEKKMTKEMVEVLTCKSFNSPCSVEKRSPSPAEQQLSLRTVFIVTSIPTSPKKPTLQAYPLLNLGLKGSVVVGGWVRNKWRKDGWNYSFLSSFHKCCLGPEIPNGRQQRHGIYEWCCS